MLKFYNSCMEYNFQYKIHNDAKLPKVVKNYISKFEIHIEFQNFIYCWSIKAFFGDGLVN